MATSAAAQGPATGGQPPAPDASAPATPEDSTEVIVTGIRNSLARAAEVKRDADQVIDVITAEDVGKLPDSNVAEALQRVTGVQITRVFGEGQSVSIRGLQQVRVEVDGRTLLGWSARLSPPENDQLGRSSGLDSVPSSLFGRLEVRKSPLASQAEGGLGGTVNLVTPKPLSFKETTLSVRAQGVYSENAEEVRARDHRLLHDEVRRRPDRHHAGGRVSEAHVVQPDVRAQQLPQPQLHRRPRSSSRPRCCCSMNSSSSIARGSA